MNENTSHTRKNEFFHSFFLEESSAWQFAFEINWPLVVECANVIYVTYGRDLLALAYSSHAMTTKAILASYSSK